MVFTVLSITHKLLFQSHTFSHAVQPITQPVLYFLFFIFLNSFFDILFLFFKQQWEQTA